MVRDDRRACLCAFLAMSADGPGWTVVRRLAALDVEDPGFPSIDDYALIGDGRTAALVAASGAIEWLCLPDISSPSVFGAILDRKVGGSFVLRPAGACEVRRRYIPGTAVLETTFDTGTGRLRVSDFMPIGDGDHRGLAALRPQRELVRIVECIAGRVELDVIVHPRPDYGRKAARLVEHRGFGWVVPPAGSLLTIRTDLDVVLDGSGERLVARATLEAGQVRTIGLSFSAHEIAVQPVTGGAARAELERTIAWWHAWSSSCRYAGANRELVVRSAITLKLLTYALSGAVVAAATTSLPEAIGADRNYDYRYCWLRDASVTMHAFLGLDLYDEAGAFIGWLLDATRLTRPKLRILYDLHGRADAKETTLDHLRGYRGSSPVRIGNAAATQLQLDTYGSVIMAAYEFIARKGRLRGGEFRLLRDFGEVVCRRWEEPDQGLWEFRGAPRHFTATKLMCWAALDRLIKLSEQGHVRIPHERFRANRDALAKAIEERGYDEARGVYVGELDKQAEAVPDAAVLLMGPIGFGDPGSERLGRTLRWLTSELGRDGLYARYPTGFDGMSSREGAFGICLSWAIEVMVAQGEHDRAVLALERFAETANDLGLFAEEYDVEHKMSLGNFPQAFTHAGYISAALAVASGSTP